MAELVNSFVLSAVIIEAKDLGKRDKLFRSQTVDHVSVTFLRPITTTVNESQHVNVPGCALAISSLLTLWEDRVTHE